MSPGDAGMPEEQVKDQDAKSNAAVDAMLTSNPANRFLGYAMVVIFSAGLLALVVLAVLDFARLAGLQPESLSEGGARTGGVVGIIGRTLILGALCALGVVNGLGRINPLRFSSAAMGMSRLEAFYRQAQLMSKTWDTQPTCDIYYAKHSDEQLAGICNSIDHSAAPERFEALLYAVKQRVESAIPSTRITEDGLAIERDGEVLDSIRWEDVRKVIAYKYDRGTTDEICLGFLTDPDAEQCFQISEERPGFIAASEAMQKQFPGTPENWYQEIMVPAFERKETVLYEAPAETRQALEE
jgi:hypothetical protein